MHTLRNSLSDICILTAEDPRILHAVELVLNAAERLAAMAGTPGLVRRTGAPPTRLNTARRALTRLDAALVGARPSHIALSLNRDW
ncbi:hypothetical protein Q8W71_30700 [Methylobacterium sp. NEAU 140]|uniref:hypothetical protein n=1 Tax=Methylobacterium sp. NEAU 140 TaxID=3064945 RepID=UPI002732E353|nr:hypothetical protein [Methylobacterium sp. NEAU 140]MDP4026962.1 hypothetical protein [Methylobacterium sp. NEAU 140]